MTDPTLAVAQDLRAILDLSRDLEDQAINKGGGDLPGGDAMVMLGPVAAPADWERRLELVEAAWFNSDQTRPRPTMGADEDPNWEPPLQTLLFWTENLRTPNAPTIATEAEWLGENLRWLYDNEPHFDDFAKDVAAARRRLEAVLYAGERDEKSKVPCIDCELDRDGRPVRIMLVVHYGSHGAEDHWICPRCKRQYDEPALRRAEYHDLARQGLDRFVRIDMAARVLGIARTRLASSVTACEVGSRAALVFWPDVRHLKRDVA